MKISRAILLAAALLAAGFSSAAPAERRPFLLGGIQLNEDDHERWAAALIQAGMNAVEVTVYAHQGPWNSARLWSADEEPAVLAEIRAARRHGLQVVLILRLALDHNEPENRFLWHGLTYPASEAQLAAWFRLYGDFVGKWARVAEAEGVEVLGIASEMSSLTATLPVAEVPELAAYYLDDDKQLELRAFVEKFQHLFSDADRLAMGAGDFATLDELLVARNQAERRWARAFTFAGDSDVGADGDPGDGERVERINHRRRLLQRHWETLIDEVRAVYGGRLTLADNFDNYHQVGFWNRLDLIGINAYFPLRATLESPLREADMKASWREVFAEVETFRKAHGLRQPVVFTELGYTRRSGVTVAPWSSTGFVPLWDLRPDARVRDDRVLLWSAQPLDPAERALAVAALFSAWRDDRLPLAGILYWKLSSRRDLDRYEPFMLYLGADAEDPLYEAFTRFADHVRPLGPRGAGAPESLPYTAWADAVTRGDAAALAELDAGAAPPPPPPGRPPLLHLAARLGHGAVVRHLIARGAESSGRDPAGDLPLHWACYQKDPGLVEALLPPDGVSWRDDRQETPLMKCARLDNVPVMRRLLRHRGDLLRARDAHGQTALRLAAGQASPEMIELLVAHDAGVDSADPAGVTPLHEAARRGDPAIVAPLARASKGDVRDAAGNRPVDYAAYFGKAEAFRLLWRPDAVRPQNASERNANGQSLLHHAAHGGDLGVLESLLGAGLAVNRADRDGRTPLHFAVTKTHRDAARLLLERGATIDRADAGGSTVLHVAAERNDAELLRLLLAHARAPATDVRDTAGNTPLHYAAAWGRVENVRLLLAAGARRGLRNAEGRTALDLAEASGRRRVVELFTRAGVQ